LNELRSRRRESSAGARPTIRSMRSASRPPGAEVCAANGAECGPRVMYVRRTVRTGRTVRQNIATSGAGRPSADRRNRRVGRPSTFRSALQGPCHSIGRSPSAGASLPPQVSRHAVADDGEARSSLGRFQLLGCCPDIAGRLCLILSATHYLGSGGVTLGGLPHPDKTGRTRNNIGARFDGVEDDSTAPVHCTLIRWKRSR